MTNMSKEQKVEKETIPPLNRLYFYLTEGCNLACRHCWLSPKFDTTGEKYPTLPVEMFEMAIQEAKPLGLKGVKLTGGEPLLHPQFKTLLEIIRNEDLALTIETNGLLCTPEVAKEIAKSSNRFVSVSIDGADAVTHDWMRGIPGSFKQARQAIRNLVETGTRPQIIMSIMRCNADQVDDVVRLAEELGSNSVKFNIVQPTGRGEIIHEGTNGLEVDEIIELGRYVDTELASNTKLWLFFDYPMAFRPLSRIASGHSDGMCGILGILGVMADGHYALCGIGKHLPELTFGVVSKDRIEGIWRENNTLQILRDGLPNRMDGICSRCLMKNYCLGSCIAQNYYSTGSLWAPFWFCECAETLGMFPASRLSVVT